MDAPREHWSRGLGFTLAAVGSAVGLGNMWRFSYMAAENGGAAFVVLYVLMTLLIGLPVMLAEFTLGRGSGRSPIEALEHYGGRRWKLLGVLFVVTGFTILGYYSVIAGWAVRYAVEGIVTGFPVDAGARFGAVSEGWDTVAWHLGFMVVTVFVVSGGVRAGIERAAVLLMPVLGVCIIGLAIYASSLEGSGAGYAYYFQTDFAEIFDFDVAKDAAGQAFFSLSLGMGTMLTYASYLSREHDLPQEAGLIAISDFGVAVVAGLVIFPLLFALGLETQVMGGETGTLGALFVVLPQAFASMGAAGPFVGGVFMVALSVAAVTSAMSLLEVVVSTAVDGLGWSRPFASVVSGTAIALLGIPAALDIGILELMDSVGGQLFLLVGGFFLAIFVGWRLPDPVAEVGETRGGGLGLGLWRFLLRWVVPSVLLVMSYFQGQTSWELIKNLAG